jgi:hypothetical protein
MSIVVAGNCDAVEVPADVHVDKKFYGLAADLTVLDISLASCRIIDEGRESFSAVRAVNTGLYNHGAILHLRAMIAQCDQAEMPSLLISKLDVIGSTTFYV